MMSLKNKLDNIIFQRSVWKFTLVFGGGLITLVALLFISLTQGQADINVQTVIASIVAPQDILEHHMVRGLRMPRAVMAMLAGAALAVAGALLQTVTRNPLASAATFGINAGAFFVVVAASVFFPGMLSQAPLMLALMGGAGAAFMAYLLAGGRKGTAVRMALAGMIVTLVLAAFTSTLQLLYENETNGLFMWGSGSLVQNDWSGVLHSWYWVVIGLVVVMYFVRTFDLLEMGDETAQSLGQRVGTARMVALAIAILLAAVTVSVVGPIGFIGLIAPHLVRLIGYRRHRMLIPASALWGAIVLVGADTIARLFHSTIGELPAGAVTAVIGAPWLIWLAVRGNGDPNRVGETTSSMNVGIIRNRMSFLVLFLIFFAALISLLVVSLSVGGIKVPVREILVILTGAGEELSRNIIMDLRLPRILVALLAGAGLGAAGVMLQGAVRNPLADPSIIGVTSGAGVGALLLIVLWPAASANLLPAAAIIGAVTASVIVYALAWRKGLNPTILILVGIAVTALNSAIIHFLVIKSGMGAAPALAWLAGSTYARGWGDFISLVVSLAILVPAAWLMGRRVDLLAFGDQTSSGLGLNLQRTRITSAFLGVALAAMVVASVGTVGFIGLLAPHAARILVGQNHRQLLILSCLLGSLLLVTADLIGRVVIAPKEIPAGLVVALIGAPYLFALMYRSRAKR